MASRSTQLSRYFLALLVAALALSFISGLGLWYVHEAREKLADGGELPAWTSFCQTTHGLLNPLLCVLFGGLLAHVVGGWRMRANRKSGAALTASFALLIITGAALYYFEKRHLYFTIHLVAGLLLPFLVGWHWFQARRWVRELLSSKEQERAKE